MRVTAKTLAMDTMLMLAPLLISLSNLCGQVIFVHTGLFPSPVKDLNFSNRKLLYSYANNILK